MKLCFVLLFTWNALATVPSVSFNSDDIQETARYLEMGQRMLLKDIYLSEVHSKVSVELIRFRVFSPGSKMILNTDSGQRLLAVPKNVYLKGRLPGSENAWVYLCVLENGSMRGLATLDQKFWVIAGGVKVGGPEKGLASRELMAGDLEMLSDPFYCQSELLGPPDPEGENLEGPPVPDYVKGTTATYTATIGLETDQEYLANFGGNTTDAINYAGDLIGYCSVLYSAEVDTAMVVGDLFLWQTTDPWTINDPNCALYDFGRYWNDNRSGVARTTAHFLSGKPTTAGIAWVGVLCRGSFNVDLSGTGCSLSPTIDNYGGAYGYSSGIDGNFDINNPAVIWDIVAVAHEIGHNFNSPHTHCYEGLGGNSLSVDACFGGECGGSGCYCGGTSLPGAGSLTGGSSGQGNGTIMSYCHLLSGGMSNLTFTFGTGHPYGVDPVRVPSRMNSHVVAQDSSNPGCFSGCTNPAITGEPTPQIGCSGDEITFSVTATGGGLNYQWRKNSVAILGKTSSTLVLSSITSGDIGDYDCVVTNTCGSVTSDLVSLNVNAPVNFTSHPSDSSLCPGDSVTLNVAVTGTAPIAYQWTKNGLDILGATSSSYQISVAETSDTGSYICRVTNPCGSKTSAVWQITVSDLVISQQPGAAHFCLGDNGSIQIQASGLGSLSYQWRKDMGNLPGQVSSTLVLINVQAGDAGSYDCVITDDCGSTTSSAAEVTTGSEALVINQAIHVQGIQQETLSATICSNSTWEWEDLTNTVVFGIDQNPVTLPYLNETTMFEIRVNTQAETLYSDQYLVLVSEAHVFSDPNGDGCNTIEDLWWVCPDWRSLGADANGNGIFEVLDFLYINMDQTLPCNP